MNVSVSCIQFKSSPDLYSVMGDLVEIVSTSPVEIKEDLNSKVL